MSVATGLSKIDPVGATGRVEQGFRSGRRIVVALEPIIADRFDVIFTRQIGL